MQIFPSRTSAIRLIGTMLDDAAESRRERCWFRELFAMQSCSKVPKTVARPVDIDDTLDRQASDVIRLAIGGRHYGIESAA